MAICRALPLVALFASACAFGRGAGSRPATRDPGTVRTLRAGSIVGTAGRYGGHAWLGVPYAKPPVGQLRWRAPEPPEAWTGTRDAVRFAAPCPQLASRYGGIDDVRQGEPTGAEDCLYLNVWAPPDAGPGARLPVMLWIHGGGDSVGHGGFFDGSRLAATQQVVVLTVNYRLGPLGWFRHAALREEAGTTEADRSGNFGTLDLVRALEWVRDDIATFGGDAGNVTIFGESAGGTNVSTLLVSPLARGLFHRAIAQSAGVRTASVEDAENASDDPVPGRRNSSTDVLLALLEADGAKDRAAARARRATMAPADVARFLRSRTSAQLLRGASPGNFGGLLDTPMVFGDGTVLPREKPFDLMGRPGRYHAVPVMLGTTRDETKVFQLTDPKVVRWWFGLVPVARDPEGYDIAAEYAAKMWKAGAADEVAARLRGGGARAWVYRFDWDEEPTLLGVDLGRLLGASHGFEIPFVFGHFDLGREASRLWTEENEAGRTALSAAMMSYWAAFAAAGDPGSGRRGELPRWEAWAGEDGRPTFLVLDTPAGGGIRMAPGALTKAAVVAEIDRDPRLPTQREKCRELAALATFSGHFTKEEYPSAGARGCRDYPLEAAL
ncbi:MAG TPA: carboxylesterase family protein [Candidatus Binatia bacterium]|nr:carboxylesterase family protein [Candidatus Binatia bacterium]